MRIKPAPWKLSEATTTRQMDVSDALDPGKPLHAHAQEQAAVSAEHPGHQPARERLEAARVC